MKIGATIKRIRIEKGVSQKILALSIGVTQTYMSLIEVGKRTPSIDVLQDAADFLDYPLPLIFWLSIEPSDIKEEKRDLFKEEIDRVNSEIMKITI